MGDKFIVYNDKLWKEYKSFEYKGEPEEFTLQPDTYLFVANGARGGRVIGGTPNITWGGTTYGILDLDHEQTFYAVVGGNGGDTTSDTHERTVGGYNGGGQGGKPINNSYRSGAAGGGASDIRLSTDTEFVPPQIVHAIPEGYDQVSYIHGNKQQTILVDYTYKANTRVEVLAFSNPDTVDLKNTDPESFLFCTSGSSLQSRLMYQIKRGDVTSDRNMYIVFGNDHRSMGNTWPSYDIQKISLELDRGEAHYTDETLNLSAQGSQTLTPESSATKISFLGATNTTSGFCKASIFYAKIFEGNKLMRWLVPYCKHTTDGESIDVSNIEWRNRYYGDTESLRFMHTESYIPIDSSCEGIRVHLKLTGKDDFIIRVDYYDSNYDMLGTSGYGISYMPYGNYKGFGTRKEAVDVGEMIIYPPFTEAEYMRIVISHATDDLDTSMIEEFSLTYLTYDGGYEAGLYDLIEGKKYPCATPVKMYHGTPVTKTVYKSRITNTKYIRTTFRRTRSNGYLSLSYLVFKNKDGNTIPISSVSAITTNGSTVSYTPTTATADNLIVESSDSWMTVNNWQDNGTDVMITYELEEEIRSDYITSYVIMTSNYSRNGDPYEWEIQISPDDVNWFTLDRRLTNLTNSSYSINTFNIFQPDAPFDLGLYSRILVAGGGGGTSIQGNTNDFQDFLGFGGGAMSSWVVCGSADSSHNAWICASQTVGNAFGQGGNAQDRTDSGTWSSHGQGGGGGGWYGGYAVKNRNGNVWGSESNGSGGSSYVLTDSSVKPENYMRTYESIMESLYFRNYSMLPNQAFDGPSVSVYKEAATYPEANDYILIPYTGSRQLLELIPGQYRIKCYGGDGAVRYQCNRVAKGGYAEGILNMKRMETLCAYVGSSAYLTGIGTVSSNKDTIFANRVAFNVNIGSYNNHQLGAMAGGGATDVRLFNPPHKIPDEYDQVEYIEANGTQYIDLNYFFNASISKFEIVVDLQNPATIPDAEKDMVLCGSRDSSNNMIVMYRVNYTSIAQYGIGSDWLQGSSSFPFGTKFRIVTTGQGLFAWYDMNGTQLGSISMGNYSFTLTRSTYVFKYQDSGGSYDRKTYGKLYSFKIYENNVLKHYYLPFKSKPDSEIQISGLYDIIDDVAYTSPIGDPFVCGDVVEKTEYDDERESLLSRIIVAGGGGGQGSNDRYGGNGGGTSGNSYNGWGYGTNNGPGTQTSTPSQSGISGGGFGYNGVGLNQNAGYGGSGGNGWFGGNGTIPDGGGDDDMGGSGGSGYVLTESSYKPSGYVPTEDYWLTETVLSTGGNPTRGMTRIEIEPVKISAAYLLVLDEESYKAYNTSTDEWESIEVEELTVEVFDHYAVSIAEIKTDTGLSSRYKLLMYDKFNIGIDKLQALVVPLTQHVTFYDYTVSEILDETFDADTDTNTDISMTYNVSGIAENRRVNVDMEITMNDVPTEKNIIYIVQFQTRNKPTSHYYPTPPEKTIQDLDLLYVGNSNSVPSRYKPHIGGFMPDGVTPITTVRASSSCEYKRNIYTATLMNGTTLRFTRFNVVENRSYIVRDNVPLTLLDTSGTRNAAGGSLLVDDNYMYLVASNFNDTTYPVRLIRVPFDLGQSVTAYAGTQWSWDWCGNGFGKAEWISSNQIAVMTYKYFAIFNTTSLSWSFKSDTSDLDNRNEFVVGKYSAINFWYSNDCNGPRVYDKSLNRCTNVTITALPKAIKCACYADGKFYVTQTGHIYVYTDNPEHNMIVEEDILTPYSSLRPKTISCSDGILYVTCANSPTLYMYNITAEQWYSTSLPFNVGAYGIADNFRPACFKGYFFIGSMKLYVTNFNTITKYRIGQKSSVLMIQTNDNFENPYEYDDRFITIDESGINAHTGYITKDLTLIDDENRIFESEPFVKSDEYNILIEYVFTLREEEDDGQE